MLQWTAQFETGQADIDSQHKTLIDYINQLEEMAHTTNPDRTEVEFVIRLMDFLECYADVHFKHEESCMARHRCPAYQENKNAHARFLEFFQQFKKRFTTEGCRPEVLKELHDTCNSWIQNHILNVDLQIKPYLPKDPSE